MRLAPGGLTYHVMNRTWGSIDDFLSVCRYAERNALRAKLVRRAENWRWSSLAARDGQAEEMKELLADWPVDRPRDWVQWVNEAEDEKELMALRCSRDRGRPYGEADWVSTTARRLGVESSLRPVGRPKKAGRRRLEKAYDRRSPIKLLAGRSDAAPSQIVPGPSNVTWNRPASSLRRMVNRNCHGRQSPGAICVASVT